MAGFPVPGYGQPVRFGPQAAIQNNPLQLLMALINQNQQGQNQALQANTSRYNDILDLFGVTRGRVMGNLSQMGNQQIADANKSYDDLRNNMMTDLANRGLSGSTKRIAVEDATKRERDAAVNRIQDSLLQNLSNADTGFTDRAAGVMERRSDPYPQTGDVGGLISQLVGAFPGALGGGSRGPQPHYYGGGAPSQYAVGGQSTTNDVNAQRAAKQASQDASANDVARQNAMAALTAATRKGGVEGEDATRQALTYLQQNGWASQNPNTGVPTVPAQRTVNLAPSPSYGPTYNYAPAGSNPYYQARMGGSPNGFMPNQKFGIAGDASSTTPPATNGLSPFGQLAGLFNMAGYAGQAANPYLSQLRSYVGY